MSIQIKKKLCDGCGELQYIFKNVTEDNERKRYCSPCWKYRMVPKPKPKVNSKPLAARSPKRSQQENQYNKRAREWKEEHPYCEIGIPDKCTHKTHDVHHMHSGSDRNLYFLDETTWKATCRACHNWIHTHPKEARDLNLLI